MASVSVEALRQDGLTLGPATDVIASSTLQRLRDTVAKYRGQLLAERRARLDDPRAAKDYVVRLLGPRPVFTPTSAWATVALDPGLVALARAYLPRPGYLEAYNVWYSYPTTAAPSHSQLWHQDKDDEAIVKVFLYLSDVTPETGALTYIPGSAVRHGQTYRPAASQDSIGAWRTSDDDMAACVPRSAWRDASGPAGTLLIADTTGWHKGGHVLRDERLVFTCMYTMGKTRNYFADGRKIPL